MTRRIILLSLALFAFALPAFAQEPSLGGMESGIISAEFPSFDHQLDLQAGMEVVITAEAVERGFDPILILYDPNGAMAAANDDIDGSGGNTNASITYAVEVSGVYTARVRGFGGSVGEFVLSVESFADRGVLVAGQIPYADIPHSRASDGAFVLGDPDAPITIIVFEDWACPHCQSFHYDVIEQVILDYVATGMAQYESRLSPTAGGDLSRFAAQIAECADSALAGGYWQAYGRLYEYAQTGRYTQDLGRALSEELGLNYTDLLACSAKAEQSLNDVAFGRAVPITGTPAILIRYGDGDPQWIEFGGVRYNSGGASYGVLAQVINAAQP